jgi:hypothetical protein
MLLARVHPLFRIEEPLPTPPGLGPFRIRGIYYDRLASYYKKTRNRAALLAALPDDLQAFMGQRFSWTGWYDVFPALPLCAAMAKVRGNSFEEFTREQTRRGATAVVPSFFRLALRVPGDAAFNAQTTSIVSSVVNFVDLDLGPPRPGQSKGWGRRVPRYIAPHTANMVLGFFQAVLEMRHSRAVQAAYTDIVEDDAREGFETVAIRYEFSW